VSPRLKQALATAALGLVGLVVALLLAQLFQQARLEAQLVAEFRALPPLPTERTSHVAPPLPGTVGDALTVALAAPRPTFPRKWRKGEPTECAQFREQPWSQYPAECREVVESQAAWARSVVASSRAALPMLPRELETETPLVAGQVPPQSTLVTAVQIVSLDVRRAALAGEADAALEWCADAFGLGRDFALRLGHEGVLFASSWALWLTGPCAEALDAATPDAKRRFAAALDAIAAALPHDGPVLRRALTLRSAEVCGAGFSDETLAALPTEVTAKIRSQNPNARRFTSPLERRSTIRELRTFRSALAAVDLPRTERDAVLARALERLDTEGLELALSGLLERFDRLRLLLALLANAARLDAGDATAADPGLALTDDAGDRVLSPATAKLARHAVRLHRDEQAPGLAP
jgi:hypothetical protein